jgi:hypothetical protein
LVIAFHTSTTQRQRYTLEVDMEKRYWVCDLWRGKRYGPYPSKKAAMKARTIVKRVSDIGMEYSSNVYVIGEHVEYPNLDATRHLLSFALGNLEAVIEENKRFEVSA